jgi:hypothetical protein
LNTDAFIASSSLLFLLLQSPVAAPELLLGMMDGRMLFRDIAPDDEMQWVRDFFVSPGGQRLVEGSFGEASSRALLPVFFISPSQNLGDPKKAPYRTVPRCSLAFKRVSCRRRLIRTRCLIRTKQRRKMRKCSQVMGTLPSNQ